MKKLVLFIITFVYMMSSTGIAMEVHYCMGKKIGVDLYKSKNEKCKKCGMLEKKGGCCKDEHQFFKLTTEYKNPSQGSLLHFFIIDLLDNSFENAIAQCSLKLCRKSQSYFCLPDKNNPPIYIMNCVFRL